jgi:DNA-directed RNA polymerase specialized sigma24 family protein
MQDVSSTAAVFNRAEVDAQLRELSGADWTRARKFARAVTFGLKGVEADDLVQEAMTKLLSGDRVWRAGIPPFVVITNVIRGVASNWRKRSKNGPIDDSIEVALLDAGFDLEGPQQAIAVNHITPERILSGQEQLACVEQAVADDEELGLLCTAWAEGLRGEPVRSELGWSVKTYEAVRKRFSRCLDKLGRTGDAK